MKRLRAAVVEVGELFMRLMRATRMWNVWKCVEMYDLARSRLVGRLCLVRIWSCAVCSFLLPLCAKCCAVANACKELCALCVYMAREYLCLLSILSAQRT